MTMNGWRTIDSAPRDGKGAFLVRYRSGHVAHVYLTLPEPPLAQTFRHCGGPLNGQQAGWPDHWMPVPKFSRGEQDCVVNECSNPDCERSGWCDHCRRK